MIVLEFKAYGKASQFNAVDEALRTVQFIRNKALRFWMDGLGKSQYDLNKYCAVLAKKFPFVNQLNSMARQASSERAWSAIARFYDNCKKGKPGKKGFPSFQKDNRSVEYKSTGWKLAQNRKSIIFTDKKGIGRLKLKGTRDLHFYQTEQIKRVRLVKRADGYSVQFCVSVDRVETIEPSGKTIGLDVGLNNFYTDSNGEVVENPRFLRKSEKVLKRSQRRVSRKIKGSNNRSKARQVLGKRHLKISRQRKDHAVKLARCVVQSNDLVAYEDLRIQNMVKNHCLAKSINDASWYQFRCWVEYFGKVFKKVTVAVNPAYTSQDCFSCGTTVKKSLSTRTHLCRCGCVLDRDTNAAKNILASGLGTVGHTGTFMLDMSNALGESTPTLAEAILSEQVGSMIKESPSF
ncbi:transposase [Desertifilum sp. FACHB-1129]|uniref:Transposase n=1 Tax=Desertifilum tharense IPPAS B-1220 TaxID=1781255 RepID=A0A1E5QEM0_9CYAN|nr:MULTISPECIES: RNA-guided endonuclease TnpB family protein [Desertifilum]MDA0209329.1 transposase [Cyanobacteria bacterium FC1]MBD2315013.1 transposase [Desertifilum sp. FACHB-1129]MBD2322872.1 transposase [Desertifilum sp. FACHB-866]MBD2332734.1 transposase [Desertifilum sp. FACHB-868]OEJ73051.1 transposase [Desertifilum tharense IPPAS B-1220]